MLDLLWLLVVLVNEVLAMQVPALEITFPEQHSWWQVSNTNGLLNGLQIYFRIKNFRIPEDGYLLVTGENVDGAYKHTSTANSVVMGGGIDPGTHFWRLELMKWNSSVAVARETLHVEVVVDISDKISPWVYPLSESEKKPVVLVNSKFSDSNTSTMQQVLPVCYISSASGGFDGQKRMWLQIMEGMKNNVGMRPVRLEFAVKSFEEIVPENPFVVALKKLNVSLQGLPLMIPRNELSDNETSEEGVVKALLTSLYRRFPLAKRSSRHLSRLDQSALHELQPRFAARIWTELVDALRSPCADGLVIFANARSVADKLVVLAARLAGARAVVMELANLHPTNVQVDVLLSPSHFAQKHYSVVGNVQARSQVVLSTGVNTQIFTPSTVLVSAREHFVIGYVGRLTSEKSLGILLAVIKLLLPVCSHCRLRIVGDGSHKSWLKSLALEWSLLNTNVEFVDGIYNDEPALINILREMHVFASPMFTETLGLAVLEAMSVGLPIVGFISAGTGEFLEDDVNCVAVPEATAQSFADALLSVVNDSDKRYRLGRNARDTVMRRFSTSSALEQYARLYERIGFQLQEVIATENICTKERTTHREEICTV